MPEYIDRDAAAGVPVTADAQVFRLQQTDEGFCNRDRAVLMEGGVVAVGGEVEFERFGFDDPQPGNIINDDVGEIGLAGYGAY